MNTTPNSPDALVRLERELDALVAATNRRRRTMTIGFAVLAVVMAGYLFFAYRQIAAVDARTVVVLAEEQVRPILERPASAWAEDLKAAAPGVIDQAGAAALSIPAALDREVDGLIDRRIDQEMPAIEAQMKQLIERLVDQAHAAAEDGLADGTMSDEEAKAVLDQIASQFSESTIAELDRIYARYTDISSQMIDYLELLATGGDELTEPQRLHRDILASFLALMQKVKQQDKSPELLPDGGA